MIGESEYLDVLERRFPEALKPWDVPPANTASGRLNQLKARVGIQVLAGQNAAARSECEEARGLLEAELAKREPAQAPTISRDNGSKTDQEMTRVSAIRSGFRADNSSAFVKSLPITTKSGSYVRA
jgi:hypothetical protein